MKIRVLGAHGSDLLVDGPHGRHICRSVGFLVNDNLAVDAGTLASGLTLDEQQRVTHIILSHLHLDHVKGIPPLVDNISGLIDHKIVVGSLASVLDGMQRHVFNDEVFPNFFNPDGPAKCLLNSQALEPQKEISLTDEITVTPVPVNHTVETAGYIIRDHECAWLYSGDTHLTENIWRIAAETPNLKGLFIEVSFPNAMMEMAVWSKHLTPSLLVEEFKKVGRPDIPLYVYHMKPSFREQIRRELSVLDIPALTMLQEGQEITL